MNILYVNHYAGSPKYGMEFRPYYLAQKWIENGHRVRILAANFSHVRAVQPRINARKHLECIDDIEYVWYSTPGYDGNGVSRVKNIAAFLWRILRDSKHTINDFEPDVVIASSTYPLDIWVAKRIAKKSSAKLIFEVHDLWPLSPIELGGMSPNHPFIMLCQLAENYAYKHSDAVVSILPKVHNHMQAHGLDLNKLHIIPNGVVEEDWQVAGAKLSDTGLSTFLQTEKQKSNLVVAYSGSHGEPNALTYFLEAAKLLKNLPIVFVLVGSGLEKKNLIAKKESEKINNVFFFNPIDKDQIPHFLAEVDIAYIGLKNESLFRFGISPNKLMDYMMAAKPIVCAIEAGNDPVGEQNCGLTVKKPADPMAIAEAIKSLAALSDEERKAMGKRGRDFVLKEHTYSALADKFLAVM